jgi:peptidoglycan hydrolase-like protein with peptidoglycan-binding domain
MSWRLAKSLEQLRSQVNAMFPARDKSSDGSIGDVGHAARKSDHNPNSHGVVTAIDIDADLSSTENVGILVAALQASGDPRIKYLIWNAHITVKGDISQWKPYHGINAHRHHAHISVASDPKLYDDARPWDIDLSIAPHVEGAAPRPLLVFGMIGDDVKALQAALHLKVDGVFGPKTEAAVKAFQFANGLRIDAMVGKQTKALLGIK